VETGLSTVYPSTALRRAKTPAMPGSSMGSVQKPIGAQGFGGPASGNEVDKFDLRNGSPKTAVVLATTLGHPDCFEIEPLDMPSPFQHPVAVRGSQTREIRSDMVLLDTVGGGQVFSVGSINWYNAMAWDNFDNSAAKVTLNVLRRFLDQASMST